MIYFAFNKNNSIFGLSEVTIGTNKKIVSHIDYLFAGFCVYDLDDRISYSST